MKFGTENRIASRINCEKFYGNRLRGIDFVHCSDFAARSTLTWSVAVNTARRHSGCDVLQRFTRVQISEQSQCQ